MDENQNTENPPWWEIDAGDLTCFTCWDGTPADVVVPYEGPSVRGFCAKHYRPRVYMMRGAVMLPHQSQQISRDLTRETIKENLGGTCHAYRLTPEQVAERHEGGPDRPYEFLVYSPKSSALSWTAFWGEEGFSAWIDAYDIAAEIPEPGESFTLYFPSTTGHLAPVVPAVTLQDFAAIHDDYKLGNTFCPKVLFLDPDTGATVLATAKVLERRPLV